MTKVKMKRQKQKKQNSKEYTNILLFFTALFVLMTGYLVWFQAFKSREVINNSYNARIEAMENQVIRGSILASDGQVLATTKVDADGTEKQRIYRRKEDMAADLMTMFQEELRVYPPWSEDRRKRYEYERQ